jgi:hypothetical protein
MRHFALILPLALLSACGGGGGSTTQDPDPDPPPDPVERNIDPLVAQCGTTVGGTTAAPNTDPAVGDTAGNAEQRGFFSFPHGLIPPGVTIQLAQLQITQTVVNGTPYTEFASLAVDHVDLDGGLDAADHAAGALSSAFGTLPQDASVGVQRTLTVTAQVIDDVANSRGLSSFRLRFVGSPSADAGADNARFELDAAGTAANLRVVYLP